MDKDNTCQHCSEYNICKVANRKRIYNPVTKKYYVVRNKTTKRGKIGQIKGLWVKEDNND